MNQRQETETSLPGGESDQLKLPRSDPPVASTEIREKHKREEALLIFTLTLTLQLLNVTQGGPVDPF